MKEHNDSSFSFSLVGNLEKGLTHHTTTDLSDKIKHEYRLSIKIPKWVYKFLIKL